MTKRGSKTQLAQPAWLTLASLALLSATTTAQDSLLGVGLREQEVFTGYDRLSMMGGARLLVRADGGLNQKAGSNFIKYQSWQVQNLPTLYGPALSRKLNTFSRKLLPMAFIPFTDRVFCYALHFLNH